MSDIRPSSASWRCRYGTLTGLHWSGSHWSGQRSEELRRNGTSPVHAAETMSTDNVAESAETSGVTILALHGWLDNAASFTRLAPLLCELLPQCEVIAADLPGHGRSDWLGEGADYAIWSAVEALYDLVTQVSPESPVVVLGHSMGSAIGMLFAGAFPRLCRGYIALDALGPITTEAQDAPQQLAKAIVSRRDRSADSLRPYASVEQAVEARRKLTPQLTPGAIQPVIERNLVAADSGLVWRTDPRLRDVSRVLLTEQQVAAFAAAIKVPALAIRAEQGIVPQAIIDQRAAYFNNMICKSLAGHHHFHLEAEDCPAIAAEVSQFIEGLA